MNMTPQAYSLHAYLDGEPYHVIGWTADSFWTDDAMERLHPVAVPMDRPGRPKVLTGELRYFRPVS